MVLEITTAKLPKLKSTQAMVDKALKSLNDRNGSSVVAVKKFIACNYDVDVEASSKLIKMCIKDNLECGKYAKTLGRGKFGSIKMAAKGKLSSKQKAKVRLAARKKPLAAPGDDGEENVEP